MRLIDADTIFNNKVLVVKTECYDAVRAVIERINNAPTVDAVPLEDYRSMEQTVNKLTKALADAEPVKHGHWTSSQGLAEVGEVQCSNCKTIYYVGDLYDVGETDENGMGQALMPNYCPHCGAKMEVEDAN